MICKMFIIYLIILSFTSVIAAEEFFDTSLTLAEALEKTEIAGKREFSLKEVSRDINSDAVSLHNKYRKKHGSPPLTFNQEIADFAQEWANKLASEDAMYHRQNNIYGENLYSYKSSNPYALATIAAACWSWYSEIEKYKFDSERPQPGTGHFTQMVWKSTREVGVGRAKSKTGFQIIVANYNPPGNYHGYYRGNVTKTRSGAAHITFKAAFNLTILLLLLLN